MRIGDVVTYLDGRGGKHQATVTAVVGSGESGYKRLNLAYFLDGVLFGPQSVPHVGDIDGNDCWYLGEYVTEPPASDYAEASTGDEDDPPDAWMDVVASPVIVELRDVVPDVAFPDSE